MALYYVGLDVHLPRATNRLLTSQPKFRNPFAPHRDRPKRTPNRQPLCLQELPQSALARMVTKRVASGEEDFPELIIYT